jgi:WD40 repeat protein
MRNQSGILNLKEKIFYLNFIMFLEVILISSILVRAQNQSRSADSVFTITGLGFINSVAFSSDGTKILTAAQNAKILLTGTDSLLKTFSNNRTIGSMAFSPDNSKILAGTAHNTTILWDVATGESLYTFSIPPVEYASVDAVAFSPDGNQFSIEAGIGIFHLYETSNGNLLYSFTGHSSGINSLAFSPDNSKILSGSTDGTAKLWDIQNKKLIQTFKEDDVISSVAFSPNGENIITGSWSNNATLWNTTSGEKIRRFLGHTDRVNCLAFSPDGSQIITGSDDNTVKLWNVSTGELIYTFKGHDGWVRSVAFSPDGKRILSGGHFDGTVRLWSIPIGIANIKHTTSKIINQLSFKAIRSNCLAFSFPSEINDLLSVSIFTISGKSICNYSHIPFNKSYNIYTIPTQLTKGHYCYRMHNSFNTSTGTFIIKD